MINRATAPVATHLALQHTITYASADVYQITSASALPVAAAALSANTDGTFDYEPPAMSVSVIVPKLETRDL